MCRPPDRFITGKHMVNYERQSEDVKSKSNHTGISKYMGSRTRGKARRNIYEIKAMRDTGPKTRTENETQSLMMEGGQGRETHEGNSDKAEYRRPN